MAHIYLVYKEETDSYHAPPARLLSCHASFEGALLSIPDEEKKQVRDNAPGYMYMTLWGYGIKMVELLP